jgi:hypothetical protein
VSHRTHALAALAAATLVLTATLVASAAPASAQTAAPSFVLAGQSAWVAPGNGILMRFSAANVPAGSQVAVTVHDALTSRSAFDQSVDGNNLPPTRDRQTFAFDDLPTDPATGQRALVYPTTSLGSSGVYPMEVDLRSANDESLAHFVTHAIVEPVNADGTLAAGQPLNVAWVWPLQTAPAYADGPPFRASTFDDLLSTGRLGRQATQLAANADVPLTLAPSPETLDAWNTFAAKTPSMKASADALRATSTTRQVLAGSFVPIDIPSLERGNLQDVVGPEYDRGAVSLENFFGAISISSTAMPGALDPASIPLLKAAGVRQLVVDGSALTPVDEKYTPAHPYKLQTPGGDDSSAVPVVATDHGLEQFLTGGDAPALRAAHLLAGLAVVAGEQPSLTRGIAIANPTNWDADNTFVSAVFGGLRGNPLLKPTTVEGLLQSVPVATVDGTPDSAPVYRQLAQTSPPLPPVTAKQYAKGVASRNSVATLVGEGSPLTQQADRALATSVASAWATPDGRRTARALLGTIAASVGTYLGQIQVQPQGTITITSSKAQIPIGFKNNGDEDITVHVKLESDRLLFPQGAERDVLLPKHQNTTVRFAVETRGSGTVPVDMTVTADGLPLPNREGSRRLSVRSTFVSGVGVFLTVGAIVFLALWWGWDIHRRRKKRAREQHPSYRLAPPSGQPA